MHRPASAIKGRCLRFIYLDESSVREYISPTYLLSKEREFSDPEKAGKAYEKTIQKKLDSGWEIRSQTNNDFFVRILRETREWLNSIQAAHPFVYLHYNLYPFPFHYYSNYFQREKNKYSKDNSPSGYPFPSVGAYATQVYAFENLPKSLPQDYQDFLASTVFQRFGIDIQHESLRTLEDDWQSYSQEKYTLLRIDESKEFHKIDEQICSYFDSVLLWKYASQHPLPFTFTNNNILLTCQHSRGYYVNLDEAVERQFPEDRHFSEIEWWLKTENNLFTGHLLDIKTKKVTLYRNNLATDKTYPDFQTFFVSWLEDLKQQVQRIMQATQQKYGDVPNPYL
jgi:hypothetical protein